MWCAHCQSDVAAELSSTDRRARCATCGCDLVVPTSAAPTTRTRQALQLLERWSRPDLLDPFEPRVANPSDDDDDLPVEPADSTEVIDEEEYVVPEPEPFVPEEPVMSASEPTHQFHSAHGPAEQLRGPHYATASMAPPQHAPVATVQTESADVRAALREEPRTNWVALSGQLLAYAGVAVLTIGTTLALWGYFAGEVRYVPTGWLVASAGQMLLFLGVITLVSSGMEHATRDLNTRFERVAAKVDRVERTLAPQTPQHAHPAYAKAPADRVAA